jgi:hypothetical protein
VPSQIRVAEVYDSSQAPAQPSFSIFGSSQIRVAEIKEVVTFSATEDLAIAEQYGRTLPFTEEVQILDLLRLTFNLFESISFSETVAKGLQEGLSISETYNTTFRRTLIEDTAIAEVLSRPSTLQLTESISLQDIVSRVFPLVEILDILETLQRQLFSEEILSLTEIADYGIKTPPPEITVPEFYTSVIPLFSIGFTALFELTKFEKVLELQGQVERERRRKRFIDINRSVGAEHDSEPLWQKYAGSVEATGWESVFLDKPEWLLGYMVREVIVDRNIMVLVLLRPTIEITNLRVSAPLYCRVVAIDFSGSTPTVTQLQEFPLLPEAKDKFGFFAYGHGLVVGVVGNQAFGIRFGDNQVSFLRFAYIAEEFRKTNPKYPSILVVPEGFIFLPNNIFYDLETFHNLPSLSAGGDNILLPIYPSKPVVVERSVSEGSVDINRAYIWQGLSARFGEMNIEPEGDLSPVAPALKGDIFGTSWVSWGLSGNDIDEHLLFKYSIYFDSDQNKWVLRISQVPYTYFPFPSVGVWTYLPSDDPRWKELLLSFTGNGEVAYFSRVWQRIYRAQMSAEEPLKVTEVYAWDGLAGQFRLKTPENPLMPFVAYDRYSGKVYAVFASIPPADPAIAIFRQTLPYSPPPAPTIVFPYNNWRVSRRPVVILRPAVYSQSQEFLLRFVPKKFVDDMNIPPEQAPGFEVYSAADRTGWYVSTDGGGTWSPMTGPVLRDEATDDILVRYQAPSALPEGGEYIVLASAYSRRS